MLEKMKRFLPYLFVYILTLYVLPLGIKDTGSGFLFLLFLIPAVLLITSIVFGLREGYCYLPAVAVALLFMPTIFLYYNTSAWIYSLGYSILVLIGTMIGVVFHKKKEEE